MSPLGIRESTPMRQIRIRASRDLGSLVWLGLVAPIVSAAQFFLPIRLTWRVLLAVISPFAGLWIISKMAGPGGPPLRRETLHILPRESPTRYDLTYRNPRWAQFVDTAARPDEGYRPLHSSDGSSQLFAQLGIHRTRASTLVGAPPDLDVWLTPLATYHVEELGPVHLELARRGIRSGFVFPERPSSAMLSTLGLFSRDAFLFDSASASAPNVLLSLNDWGPVEVMINHVRRRGGKVLAKVEGTQDFRNVDTPLRRPPYSVADCVLAQGPYDSRTCLNNVVVEVGSSRLESLGAVVDAGQLERIVDGPLLNVNFSYGIGGAWSRPWYSLAARSVRRAGLEHVATVHPAVAAPWATNVSPWPISLSLETSSHFVSRRSASILDALQMGRPVIYFNPHRELAWRDVPWDDAVPVAHSGKTLSRQLVRLDPYDHRQFLARREFLRRQFVSVLAGKPSEARTADVLEQFLG